MRAKNVFIVMLLVGISSTASWSFFKEVQTAPQMTQAAQGLLATLDEQQLATTQQEYDSPQRFDWHFIPKDERKGLQIKHMNKQQRKAAHKLLKAALSQSGYKTTTGIMRLEALLHALEGGKGRNIRDPERYYFTIFGKPAGDQRWGLSFEGHHLSLNFVVEGEQVVSSTPQFFATNPGEVKSKNDLGIPQGTRLLADEELVAFELVNSLSEEQKSTALLAPKAPREIRAAGEAQPPTDPPAGIPAAQLNARQQKLLRKLIDAYVSKMPQQVAAARLQTIEDAGFDKVHFAWAGALKEGVGHYYRVQGPSFLIELVNTQPDAAGNPANHVHSVWRDMRGDFAVSIEK